METPRFADAGLALRHVFLRDLMLDAAIGVYASEHGRRQRIRVNVDLAVEDDGARRLASMCASQEARVTSRHSSRSNVLALLTRTPMGPSCDVAA